MFCLWLPRQFPDETMNTPKRSILIYFIMLWMVLAIPAVTVSVIRILAALFRHSSLVPKIFHHMGLLFMVALIIELVYLWKINSKALIVADALCGAFAMINILSLTSALIRSTNPTLWQLAKPLLLLIVNVAMIIYITRHSFLDRSAAIAQELKAAEANKRFDEEQLAKAWEIRKRQKM